jgi:hypothetical protein
MAIDRTMAKLTREIQWRRIPVFAFFAPDHRFGRSTSRTSNFARRRSKSAQRAKGRASFNLQLHNHEQQQTQYQHRLGVRHRACATL